MSEDDSHAPSALSSAPAQHDADIASNEPIIGGGFDDKASSVPVGHGSPPRVSAPIDNGGIQSTSSSSSSSTSETFDWEKDDSFRALNDLCKFGLTTSFGPRTILSTLASSNDNSNNNNGIVDLGSRQHQQQQQQDDGAGLAPPPPIDDIKHIEEHDKHTLPPPPPLVIPPPSLSTIPTSHDDHDTLPPSSSEPTLPPSLPVTLSSSPSKEPQTSEDQIITDDKPHHHHQHHHQQQEEDQQQTTRLGDNVATSIPDASSVTSSPPATSIAAAAPATPAADDNNNSLNGQDETPHFQSILKSMSPNSTGSLLRIIRLPSQQAIAPPDKLVGTDRSSIPPPNKGSSFFLVPSTGVPTLTSTTTITVTTSPTTSDNIASSGSSSSSTTIQPVQQQQPQPSLHPRPPPGASGFASKHVAMAPQSSSLTTSSASDDQASVTTDVQEFRDQTAFVLKMFEDLDKVISVQRNDFQSAESFLSKYYLSGVSRVFAMCISEGIGATGPDKVSWPSAFFLRMTCTKEVLSKKQYEHYCQVLETYITLMEANMKGLAHKPKIGERDGDRPPAGFNIGSGSGSGGVGNNNEHGGGDSVRDERDIPSALKRSVKMKTTMYDEALTSIDNCEEFLKLANSLLRYLKIHRADPDNSLVGVVPAESVIRESGNLLQRNMEIASEIVEMASQHKNKKVEGLSKLLWTPKSLEKGDLVIVRVSPFKDPTFVRICGFFFQENKQVTHVKVWLDPLETHIMKMAVGDIIPVTANTAERILSYDTDVLGTLVSLPTLAMKEQLNRCGEDRSLAYLQGLGVDIDFLKRLVQEESSSFVDFEKLLVLKVILRPLVSALSSTSVLNPEEHLRSTKTYIYKKIAKFISKMDRTKIFVPKIDHVIAELSSYDSIIIEKNRLKSYYQKCKIKAEQQMEAFLSGHYQIKFNDWVLLLIEQSSKEFLKIHGYDFDAMPDDFLAQKPTSLAVVRRNWDLLRNLLAPYITKPQGSFLRTRGSVLSPNANINMNTLPSFVEEIAAAIRMQLERLIHRSHFALLEATGRFDLEAFESASAHQEGAAWHLTAMKDATLSGTPLDKSVQYSLMRMIDGLEYMVRLSNAAEDDRSMLGKDSFTYRGLVVGEFARLERDIGVSWEHWSRDSILATRPTQSHAPPLSRHESTNLIMPSSLLQKDKDKQGKDKDARDKKEKEKKDKEKDKKTKTSTKDKEKDKEKDKDKKASSPEPASRITRRSMTAPQPPREQQPGGATAAAAAASSERAGTLTSRHSKIMTSRETANASGSGGGGGSGSSVGGALSVSDSTPLLEAVRTGNKAQVLHIIETNPLLLNRQDKSGNTAFLLCCRLLSKYEKESQDIFLFLLAQEGLFLSLTTNSGQTGLHLLPKKQPKGMDDLDIVRLLVDKGCNVNQPNLMGETPLHAACLAGDIPFTQALLEHGANPDALTNNLQSCLHYAVSGETPKIVLELFARGAKLESIDQKDNKGESPLELARKRGSAILIAVLEEHKMP